MRKAARLLREVAQGCNWVALRKREGCTTVVLDFTMSALDFATAMRGYRGCTRVARGYARPGSRERGGGRLCKGGMTVQGRQL